MPLEDKLTEEQKLHILNEVERERIKNLLIKLYEDGLSNSDPTLRDGTVATLNFLHFINPLKRLDLFRKYVSLTEIQEGVTESEGSLIYSDAFVDLWNDDILMDSEKLEMNKCLTEKMHQELAELGVIDPLELRFLIYSNLSEREYERNFSSFYHKQTAEKYINLFILSINYPEDFGEEVLKLYDQAVQENSLSQKLNLIQLSNFLAVFNINNFLQLYLRGITDKEAMVRSIAAFSLGELALHIRNSWVSNEEVIINDEAHQFLIKYLDSRYIVKSENKLKSTEEIILELKHLVQDFTLNYYNLIRIIDEDKACSLEEIVECSNLECPGYQVIKRLGAGVAGVTYKAFSEALGQARAIKTIHLEKVNTKEAELMARLEGQHSDNIVRIYDAGDHILASNGKKYYAILMEYVDGMTLSEICKDGALPNNEVLDYSAQIFSGILSLREYGITHRDLHPRNIKVNAEGVVKILDFGIATDNDNPEAMGNRRYGSPANASANDFFSLGLITYRMAAGEHLVSSRGDDEGTETYADRIAEMKKYIFDENGIKDEYKTKIKYNIPQELRGIVISCLECNTPETIQEKYEQARNDLRYHFMSKDDLIARIKELEKEK